MHFIMSCAIFNYTINIGICANNRKNQDYT